MKEDYIEKHVLSDDIKLPWVNEDIRNMPLEEMEKKLENLDQMDEA